MVVGMIDQDVLLYGYKRPNLELMKFSSYHKARNDIVEFVTDVRDISHYSKVYLRKTKADKHYPYQVIAKSNVEWGGLAFTGTYELLPNEIEFQKADFTLYYSYLEEKVAEEKLRPNVLAGRSRNFLRITNQGDFYNKDFVKRLNPGFKTVILYDDDFLLCPEWEEIMAEMPAHTIQLLNYILVDSLEDFHRVRNCSNLSKEEGRCLVRLPDDPKMILRDFMPQLTTSTAPFFPLEIGYGARSTEDMLIKAFNTLDVVFCGLSRGYPIQVSRPRNQDAKKQFTPFLRYLEYFTQRSYAAPYSLLTSPMLTGPNKELLIYGSNLMGGKGRKIISTPMDKLKKEVWKLGYS